MPTYEFQNTETGETFEKILKLSEREPYLKENPHLKQIISGARPVIEAARLGRRQAALRDQCKQRRLRCRV